MLPFIPIGIAVTTALFGAAKGVGAALDQSDANSTNSLANDIAKDAKEEVDKSRKESGEAITRLGERKISILTGSMGDFINSFEKLHNVELKESVGLDELKKFTIDSQSVKELRELSCIASSLAGGAAGGAALGAITAFGAYSGAMALGTASTGAAIGGLTGIAAQNATLAFLGGGALSAGGLGIAGGTMVLGGLVAGPALAVFGLVAGSKAKANKELADANYEKAKAFEEEMYNVRIACNGIRMRATMFNRLLLKLNAVFEPMIYNLERIVIDNGTDYSAYTDEQKGTVAACLSIAGAIKAVLDTPILDEDGNLTAESEAVIAPTNKLIEQYI